MGTAILRYEYQIFLKFITNEKLGLKIFWRVNLSKRKEVYKLIARNCHLISKLLFFPTKGRATRESREKILFKEHKTHERSRSRREKNAHNNNKCCNGFFGHSSLLLCIDNFNPSKNTIYAMLAYCSSGRPIVCVCERARSQQLHSSHTKRNCCSLVLLHALKHTNARILILKSFTVYCSANSLVPFAQFYVFFFIAPASSCGNGNDHNNANELFLFSLSLFLSHSLCVFVNRRDCVHLYIHQPCNLPFPMRVWVFLFLLLAFSCVSPFNFTNSVRTRSVLLCAFLWIICCASMQDFTKHFLKGKKKTITFAVIC